MAQWSANGSNPAGVPNWVGTLVNKTPNTGNRDALYNNTVANTHVTNQVVGVVSVDATEIGVHKEVTHTGHHKRTVGTSGRAGRVHYECLVAGGISGSNTGDDSFLPAPSPNVVIDLQPYPPSGNNGNDSRTFSVVAHVVPRTMSVNAYQWQFHNGSAFVNVAASNSTQQGGATAFLLIPNTAAVDGNIYRCNVSLNATVFALSTNVTVT